MDLVPHRNAPPAAPYDLGHCFDEAYDADGRPREHYRDLLAELATQDLDALERTVCNGVIERGLEFAGPGGASTAFTVDPVPRLISAEEWAALDAGLAQRTRALHAFLVDSYGEQAIVGAGVVPAHAVTGAPGYEPDLVGAAEVIKRSPLMAGFDVVRGHDGRFEVLEDNLRTPSGSAYAVSVNEIVADRVPGPTGAPQHDLRAACRAWLDFSLRGSGPRADDSIALLSDGPTNSAWFEHTAIADLLGLPIVTLADLEVHGSELFAWVEGSRRRIDTLYRRTDDSRLRDEEGRQTALGEALLRPWRDGRLTCVNGFGTGVADDKLVHAYVEDMVRFYLGQEPMLRSVTTHDLGDPDVRSQALARLTDLVVKPRFGHGGWGVVVCAHAEPSELASLARRVNSEPERYIAQDLVMLSRHPTVAEGTLQPRHVDLRIFAVGRGEECAVLPGGLTRYARAPGAMVVNSSQGGGAKDTRVLA